MTRKQLINIMSKSLEESNLFKVIRIDDGITNCVKINATVNNQEIRQIGIAVKGPNDKPNSILGYKIAYGRALKKMSMRILNDKSRWGLE